MSSIGDWKVKPEVRRRKKRQRKPHSVPLRPRVWGSEIDLMSVIDNCDKIVSTYDDDDQCTRMVFWRAGREVLTLNLTWTANAVSGNDNLTLITKTNVNIP